MLLPSENNVLQNSLKAFRCNKIAPVGYKVSFVDGVNMETWHDEAGKNPRDVKVFQPPYYDLLDAEGEILFSIGAYFDESNQIKFHVLFDGDTEKVHNWDEAVVVGFNGTVLAEFNTDLTKKASLSDALSSLNSSSPSSSLKR